MKKLEIKEYGIPKKVEMEGGVPKLVGGKQVVLEYQNTKDWAIACLNNPSIDHRGHPLGFSPSEMRERINIIDKFEKSKVGEEVILEETESKVLKSCVGNMKWKMLHADIIDFDDSVKGMEDYSPK